MASEIRGGVQPKADKVRPSYSNSDIIPWTRGRGSKTPNFADVLYGWLIRHFDPL